MSINNENNSNHNTYDINRILISADGSVMQYIYENDKVQIKTPKDLASEERIKYLNMIEERDELSCLIASECGSFYFNFFNGGLVDMDMKESVKLRFLYLCTYTNYTEKGMYLVYDNGKKMDRGGIGDVLNLSDRELSSTITSLVKNKLIIKEGRHYMINGDVAHRGKLSGNKIKQSYSRIFDNGLRELYDNCDAKQHKQLYYLFKLLPYVNLKYNAICQNPSENIAEDVIPLRLSEICEVVGYNSKNSGRLKKDMYELHLFGQYAILGIENKNGMWFKINPRVLYAGTGSHLEEFKTLLCTDFSISK